MKFCVLFVDDALYPISHQLSLLVATKGQVLEGQLVLHQRKMALVVVLAVVKLEAQC